MARLLRSLLAAAALASLSGCLLNDVSRLSEGHAVAPSANRAIVIYGLGVEGPWSTPKFAISLDEYSVERQSITGNCWRHNRMEAVVNATHGVLQYFAFDVEPGHYVFSGFNAASLDGPRAFSAPAGSVVFLGEFVAAKQRNVMLRRNLAAASNGLGRSFPSLREKVVLAEAMSVGPVGVFVCTP